MRISLRSLAVLGTVAVGATLQVAPPAAAAAPIYPWCMQPVGTWGPDCSYTTIEQCRASAAAVGFCYQNPAYSVAIQGRPDRMRR